ncbi:MAG: hypothetical protein WDN25_29195 [Acetobacteraceae bacterium]
MDPKFLREEAARFRGMAETQDREASKLRLLKMAADYESKAEAGDTPPPKATGAKAAKKAIPADEEPLLTSPQ